MTKYKGLIALLFLVIVSPFFAYAQVVQYQTESYECSGFLARMNEVSQNIYLITAGHCLEGLMDNENPNKVIMNQAIQFQDILKVGSIENNSVADIHLKKIIFATNQLTDLAILEITETAVELKQKGITSFIVVADKRDSATAVKVVNPLTKEIAECFIDKRPYKLSFELWHWYESGRLSANCKLGPGWSGAPVIESSSLNVIGAISGGNDQGSCDDYCETDKQGNKSFLKGAGYFSILSFLIQCANPEGKLDPLKCNTELHKNAS